ncbi:protein NEGATIVE GRAVITROPIC RESPONSE OF ROOTS [Populus alba]|uniref:protein NEGATIVE GRAVITROPIC RESPONSE OF ROOTS n=1 Tax=Populus alba TaxID=43335 RepID=UPI0015894AFA|nr:uncharacterized protein LOC118048268 [Populus alba]
MNQCLDYLCIFHHREVNLTLTEDNYVPLQLQIVVWMQNKLYRRHDSKKPNSISVDSSDSNYHEVTYSEAGYKGDGPIYTLDHIRQESRKEEFIDWPNELLAIGTFGNKSIKEEFKHNHFSQNLPQELTPEEVGKLQNELSILLHKQGGSTDGAESETANFFNNQTSMEDDSTNSDGCSDESKNKDCCVQANTEVTTSRRKDIWADTSAAINKKSLSFLLKKMFICGGGFSPTPSLKNQVPESRMEKILRAILHRKIYPQNPSPKSSTKKYLENKQKPKSAEEDGIDEKADEGSKWVKTDSEYNYDP